MDVSGDDRSLWLATYIVPHESALRDWLSRLAGIAADQVDDLVQETYAVLATRADVSGIQNPRAYAFQVARSILLQQLRRARVVTLGTLADLDQLGEVADLPTPEQHAVARDEYARVVQAIAQMPPQTRRAFQLRRIDGLSQREIAAELGLSENTVEKHIMRGIKMLMAQFGRGGKPLLMHLTLSRKDNCPIMTGRACAQTIDDEAAAWTARIDRGLSDSDQAELDAWLAQDSRRVGALARARAIWLHAERAESLAPLITEPEVVETPRHGVSRRRMMLGGAGALAAGLVGVVTMSPWLRPAPALRSGIGEIRRIPLADGSVVTLDTDSALEVVYSTTTRLVRLIAGGAYFEVASSSRPFMVEVGGIVLRATAAAFAVQALPDSPLSVLVERGAVAMGKAGQSAIVDLAASTRITLEKGSALTAAKTHKLASGEMDRALVWRNGMLSFEGETLEQAAATFRRYGRPFIEITDPALARRPITGLFSANDPAGFARTAALSLDARATVDGNVARLVPLNAR